MAVMQFEERFDVTLVESKLFKKLWKDNKIQGKYYVTIDFNFIRTLYAKNDEEAKKDFYEDI